MSPAAKAAFFSGLAEGLDDPFPLTYHATVRMLVCAPNLLQSSCHAKFRAAAQGERDILTARHVLHTA